MLLAAFGSEMRRAKVKDAVDNLELAFPIIGEGIPAQISRGGVRNVDIVVDTTETRIDMVLAAGALGGQLDLVVKEIQVLFFYSHWLVCGTEAERGCLTSAYLQVLLLKLLPRLFPLQGGVLHIILEDVSVPLVHSPQPSSLVPVDLHS